MTDKRAFNVFLDLTSGQQFLLPVEVGAPESSPFTPGGRIEWVDLIEIDDEGLPDNATFAAQ